MADIIIFGAGGRAGRAATLEAVGRGHHVTAVVRDPERHRAAFATGADGGGVGTAGGAAGTVAGPAAGAAATAGPAGGAGAAGAEGGRGPRRFEGVDLVAGDITDGPAVGRLVRGHDAAINAVSPFTGPEQGFDTLDPDFFVKAADVLLAGLAAAGVPRLLVVGLFANLTDAGGRPLMDDPNVLPPEVLPFVRAHTAGLERLRAVEKADPAPVDWLVLTPPARLDRDGPRTGRYRVGGDAAADSPHLSYADLAVALLDEIESPSHHRTRISVFD